MDRSLLTTDIMEAQFGPVEASVLFQDERRREVVVRVRRTKQVLEFARVTFAPAGAAAYPAIDRRIRGGALMGKAFRDAGVEFRRRQEPPARRELSGRLRELFAAGDGPGLCVSASILVGPEELPYAENRETYSPAIEWPEGFAAGRL